MGRITTPAYRLEMTITGGMGATPQGWRTRSSNGIPADGPTTVEAIDRWVTGYEESLRPGGVNAHAGIHSVVTARIVRQSDGQVMAEWKRSEQRKDEPMFQVIS